MVVLYLGSTLSQHVGLPVVVSSATGGAFLMCLGEHLKAVANIEKGEVKVKNPPSVPPRAS